MIKMNLKNWKKVLASLAFTAASFLPLNLTAADSVIVDNVPSVGIDNTQIILRHHPLSSEGKDGLDSTSFPPMVNNKALRLWTNPYSTNLLSSDSRPSDSFTPFVIDLTAKDNEGSGITTSNYLSFSISSPLDGGREDYKVEVNVWGNGSSNTPYFTKTYGLQNLVSNLNSKTESWNLSNISNDVKYGEVIMTPLTNIYNLGGSSAAYTVTITDADKYGLSPTEFVNLDAGSSITSSVADATNFYYYVSPTERDKVTGLEDVLSVDTGTSTQVGADFVYSPINSSLDLKPTEEKEFKFEAYSFDTSRGTVSGDTNSWVVSNGLINVSANANPFFHLHSWSNVPSGMETNENLSYNLGAANTNVYATFAPDTTSNGVPHERIYNDTGITNFVPGIESQDPDNDGLSILEEWLADTNMGDSNSVLPNLYISQDGLGNRYVEIGPETSWERVYELKSKKDLTDINQAQLVYTSPGVGSNLQFDVSSDTNSVNFYSYEVGLPQPE